MKFLLVISVFLTMIASAQQADKFIIGRTSGPLPFLEFGLGDDRLGGAKMTYLDSNILVKIIDSVKDDYKVKLSNNHIAWLPKVNFKIDDSTESEPYYLTGSWRVYGDNKYDFVTVNLDERLPYRSMHQVNPSKIVIDIFGVVSNTNWITQLSTAKEVKNVYYEPLEDDVFRVIIELRHQQHWGHYIFYNNNTLTIRIKRQPDKLTVNKLLVAIDAGHGGANTGASGVNTKISEKDYTLKIAKELEKYLKAKKIKTFMTRTEDVDITMIDRTLMLREQDPDILISIHLNSSSRDTIKGVSTYYRYIGFRPLSQAILKRMLELKLNEFGNIGAFNFSLSGPTEYPNCLVEVAFLSNPADEKKIRDLKFQKNVAVKIYEGIVDWVKKVALQ